VLLICEAEEGLARWKSSHSISEISTLCALEANSNNLVHSLNFASVALAAL
jgi:hypothetical protein